MEVWWAGFQLSNLRLLGLLAFTITLLLGYNVYAGVRPNETWAGVIIDSIEELGLGLLLSAAALFLIGRITVEMPLREVVGKTVVEAMLVAIGISIGTAQMGMSADDDEDDMGKRPSDILGVIVVSICGAVVFVTNIAATDEVLVLTFDSSTPQLIGIVVLSLLLAALMTVFSNYLTPNSDEKVESWKGYLFAALLAYGTAFLSAASLLFLLGRFDGLNMYSSLAMCIIVSLASVLGAAGGRLIIK